MKLKRPAEANRIYEKNTQNKTASMQSFKYSVYTFARNKKKSWCVLPKLASACVTQCEEQQQRNDLIPSPVKSSFLYFLLLLDVCIAFYVSIKIRFTHR